MRITQIVSGTAVVIAALACAHKQQEPGASDNSRIKPSSANTARDTAAEYGNQGTRMGASSDSSRREQTRGTTSAPDSTSGSATGTAGQNDPNLIGSPAWWRTHLTADGKPRP
ncbi:MAG TPA: hypothetical protein VIM15_12055 [Gemmatimonadaceae bacterium]